MTELQRSLLRSGQHIPGLVLDDPDDLAPQAGIHASSRLRLSRFAADGPWRTLDDAWAMLLPVATGSMPRLTLLANVAQPTHLVAELRLGSRPDEYTPERTLARLQIDLKPDRGEAQPVVLDFGVTIDEPRYVFVCLKANPLVALRCSESRVTGVLALTHRAHPSVARSAVQRPPAGSGIDTLEFWQPQRRPGGQNFALEINPPIDLFGPEQAVNGRTRPGRQPNAWVADRDDERPTLTLRWDQPRRVTRVELVFDTDFDHPMESVLMGHPEHVMPFCVNRYTLRDGAGRLIASGTDHHQTRATIRLASPIETDALIIELERPSPRVPAALFQVRAYADA